MNTSKGFTLIELIIVIIILGILAATVAPKYIDLKADAQTATLEAVKASLAGAAALVHSKSIVAGNHGKESATINLASGTLSIRYGYPIVPGPFSTPNVKTYWDNLIDIDDGFVYRVASDQSLIIYPSNAHSAGTPNSSAACLVKYTVAVNANGKPNITVNKCI